MFIVIKHKRIIPFQSTLHPSPQQKGHRFRKVGTVAVIARLFIGDCTFKIILSQLSTMCQLLERQRVLNREIAWGGILQGITDNMKADFLLEC